MSILIKASSLPKNSLANTLASSVLPTPVGPRNIKEPIGRLPLLIPVRLRLTALATATTASSCPITCLLRVFSRPNKYFASDLITFVTGTPVILATTSATSSLVTFRVLVDLPSLCSFFSSLLIWLALVLC